MIIRINMSFLGMAFAALFCSCTDFVQVDPPKNRVNPKLVFSDEAAANSAMRGIYSDMTNHTGFASGSISSVTFLAGRSADDFTNYSTGDAAEFSNNALLKNNSVLKSGLWDEMYLYIYYANSALEGLSQSTTLRDSVKNQFTGEAKFVRAFCYFYLVNLFGEVPIIKDTDYEINKSATKSTVADIWKFLITDLLEAQNLLEDGYAFAVNERVRPNRWAAKALLARAYLFTSDWTNAEKLASEVIANTNLYSLNSLDQVFLKNSNEAIWQLIPSYDQNTNEAASFILSYQPDALALSPDFLTSFESGDLRKDNWIGSFTDTDGITYFYPNKYKVRYQAIVSEYSMVLRLAEQYLIRSESRVRLNKLPDAIADIDTLRKRAGLPLITDISPSITSTELQDAILHERRIELFSEWGHRWLDLKRTNNATKALGPIKGIDWQATDELYPIPQSEINNNPALLPQNPGY